MVNLSKDFGHLLRSKELSFDFAEDTASERTLLHYYIRGA